MKLADLARKASRLPDLEFDWAGLEQWDSAVFEREVKTLPDAISSLRRMWETKNDLCLLRW